MIGSGDLGGEEDAGAPVSDGFADLGLAVEVALSGVDEGQTRIQGSVNCIDRLLVFHSAERSAERPCAEADDRHFRPVAAESPRPHGQPPSLVRCVRSLAAFAIGDSPYPL